MWAFFIHATTNQLNLKSEIKFNDEAVEGKVEEIANLGIGHSTIDGKQINASDVIVVNAEVVDQEMSKTVNGTTTNIYHDQDFTCDNFLFLDPGTFKVRFDPGVSEKTTCKFQFLEMYEGN